MLVKFERVSHTFNCARMLNVRDRAKKKQEIPGCTWCAHVVFFGRYAYLEVERLLRKMLSHSCNRDSPRIDLQLRNHSNRDDPQHFTASSENRP